MQSWTELDIYQCISEYEECIVHKRMDPKGEREGRKRWKHSSIRVWNSRLGVIEVIDTNGKRINQRVGDEIYIKYVLDIRDFPGTRYRKSWYMILKGIVKDPEVQIVVEVMGGIEPAYTFVKRCLLAGKSVATSNKALVANTAQNFCRLPKRKYQPLCLRRA